MHYDIIVIGAGLGGLTAGAKLAKEGRKVLLIEQHDRPGGCATTFRRHDFTFEVGLHEMDGLDARDMKTKIFRDLGVFDHVEFLKVPEFYHFVHGSGQFTMPHDAEQAIKELVGAFPQEEAGIRAYFDQLLNARKKLKESEGQPERTVGEFLDSMIGDDNLKLVLLGNLGYFHDDPYSLSLSYYSIAQGSYFQGGGNFIKGGSQMLSDYLASVITANGGEVLLNHEVTGIMVDGDMVTGVRYRPAKKDHESLLTAYGREIIANAALPNVANVLLPEETGKPLAEQIADLPAGASLLTLYLGFSKELKEIGSRYYSTFFYDESVKSLADIRENNGGPFSRRSFTFVDYSQVDSALAPAGKSVGVVCCIDYLHDWDNLSPAEYKAKKEEVARIFIGKLEEFLPGITDLIEYYEVGTAKTVARYTRNPEGAVYGFAQTPYRTTRPIPQTLSNLHFASAWTKTGGGFSGAIYSGYLCAMGIMRK
ncbi:MAG: NAD(P)/FAD-dependent oxidoreductase [Bacteroidales bacterium]